MDAQRLDPQGQRPLDRNVLGPTRDGQVEAFRRFLKLETERLRMRHRLGLGGAEIAGGRSDQVDLVVTRVCQVAAEEADPSARRELSQCALVALGGYGRRELAPFSDVDLLFLHAPGRVSEGLRRFVERALQLLWDVGLSVGHAVRSPRECVSLARTDLHARTTLTEARLVTGSAPLFASLTTEVEAGLGDARATRDFFALMRAEVEERHARWGRAVGLQEPNVKEGVGGLRDLHTVIWLGHALYGSRGLHGLHREGRLPDADYVGARRAHDFLSRVRNEAHFATGRRADLLTLDLQPELAKALGYQARGGLLASELFMRDYYRRAAELFHLATRFLLHHVPAPKPARTRVREGFEVQGGELFARGGLKGGPLRVLECVAVAQAEGVQLSDSLRHAARERLPLVDVEFRTSRGTTKAFLRLFDPPGPVAPALRALHEAGFLGRLIPEFARVTFLVQHDHFHRYTVDEHTLKAISALDEVARGDESVPAAFGQIFAEIENRTALYLGLLLHDVGKGRGGGHVARGVKIAERVVRRLGLEPRTAEDVLFLVGAHLEMSQLSQQRDVTEPGVAEAFARRVGTLDRLNQLLVLTYADHRGVGPGIWNDWKASLLGILYGRTRPHLPGGERRRRTRDDAAGREAARAALVADFSEAEVDAHLAQMPLRYLGTTDAGRMVRHFRLLRLLEGQSAVVEWQDVAQEGLTELTVAARDRPGLFASLAGTLTVQGLDILSVDVFTRRDGRALDTFRVSELRAHRPVLPERRDRIARALIEAAAGRLDVPAAVERWRAKARRSRKLWGRAVKEPRVRFDLEASSSATVVDVRAPDEAGLAYTLAHTLSGRGLDIRFARIATAKALALDVFYVTDASGRKLSPEERAGVEEALLGALGAKGRSRNLSKEA